MATPAVPHDSPAPAPPPPHPLAVAERFPPRGRGWSAAMASLLEASAPKPGNVHPAADFPDLTYAELVAAGLAIAPALETAAGAPLGRTILDAVTAARQVTRSNANLGIVLLIAPLAAVPDEASPNGTAPARSRLPAAVVGVLDGLTAADAADVWTALRRADPGGMGSRSRHDLSGPPPDDLLEAMRLAAPHDTIARLWTAGFGPLLEGPVADLEAALRGGHPPADAIVATFLRQLAREPDSLIARKHGPDAAADVSRRAAETLARPDAIPEFDRFLRAPRRLNPGTTADLVAAALYILLREGGLTPDGAFPGDAAVRQVAAALPFRDAAS